MYSICSDDVRLTRSSQPMDSSEPLVLIFGFVADASADAGKDRCYRVPIYATHLNVTGGAL